MFRFKLVLEYMGFPITLSKIHPLRTFPVVSVLVVEVVSASHCFSIRRHKYCKHSRFPLSQTITRGVIPSVLFSPLSPFSSAKSSFLVVVSNEEKNGSKVSEISEDDDDDPGFVSEGEASKAGVGDDKSRTS